MATKTIAEAFAAAMELKSAEDRATLARWLTRCTAVDLHLEPNSVRRTGDAMLREIFDGVAQASAR
ncbi:MAG TPA: hypothetical protein VF217_01500 [Rhodanobacteraceae bacterium]